MNLAPLSSKATKIIREVGAFISENFEQVTTQDAETKELNSLVSYVDKEAERRISQALSTLLPEAGFITEEESIENTQREYTWVIDPLDGTTNFLYGIPVFSISVALLHHSDIMLGIVYDVMQDDMYHAIKDRGAYKNDEKLSVSCMSFDQSLIATGFPYRRDYDYDRMMEIMQAVLRQSRGIRRLGSAAIDLAYVAAGRYSGYYERYLNLWDIAAGILLVREAGGIATDFNGMHDFSLGEIIAGSPATHPHLITIITP